MKLATRFLTCTALAAVLGGCGTATGSDNESTQVVVGFYPLQYLAERIGGDGVEVTSLAQPGAEPHDLELAPQQIQQVTEADLVLYLGGLQPAVDDVVAQNAQRTSFDVLDATEVAALPAADGGGPDPHVWLDPSRYAELAAAVADRLVAVDPGREQTYRSNETALIADLTALTAEYRTGLGDCERRDIVTTHAAFGYLARAFGLEQVAIAGLSPQDEPSPQSLDRVRRFAEEHDVTTIFYESGVSPDYADTVADQIGAGTAVLSPIEVVAPGEDYLSVMRANLATLQAALGCTHG